MKLIDLPHLCLFFMTPCKKCAILIINVFEYCPRGYIEGGYYFFTRISTAGTIRMRVLFEGGPYMRKYGTYCQYCQLDFSSEIEVPQLGSARNLHSSDSLKPENSSSNSSLLISMTMSHYFYDLTYFRG